MDEDTGQDADEGAEDHLPTPSRLPSWFFRGGRFGPFSGIRLVEEGYDVGNIRCRPRGGAMDGGDQELFILLRVEGIDDFRILILDGGGPDPLCRGQLPPFE